MREGGGQWDGRWKSECLLSGLDWAWDEKEGGVSELKRGSKRLEMGGTEDPWDHCSGA